MRLIDPKKQDDINKAKERRDVKRRIRQLTGSNLNAIISDLNIENLRRLRSALENRRQK